jgi:molybdopterin converting factor small subunit
MTTSGPEGPMINRRNVVKDDHVTVDVTHEEDEKNWGTDERAKAKAAEPRWVVAPVPEDWPKPEPSVAEFLKASQDAHEAQQAKPLLQDASIAQLLATLREKTANRRIVDLLPTSTARLQALRDAAKATFPETVTTVGDTVTAAGYQPKTTPVDPAVAARQLATYAVGSDADQRTLLQDATTDRLLIALGRRTRADSQRSSLVDQIAAKAESIRATETTSQMEALDEISAEMLRLGDSFDPETERMTRRQQQVAIANIAYNLHRLADLIKGPISG